MNIQFPFTAWDVLAAVGQTLAMFWDASSPGLRIIIGLLIVFGVWARPERETSPRRFRRRRYRNRWDD